MEAGRQVKEFPLLSLVLNFIFTFANFICVVILVGYCVGIYGGLVYCMLSLLVFRCTGL